MERLRGCPIPDRCLQIPHSHCSECGEIWGNNACAHQMEITDGTVPTMPSELHLAGQPQGMVRGRISRDELGLQLAEVYAQRSTCTRAQVGCIITLDGRPVAGGYAGAPSGQPHCTDAGCDIGNHKGCTRTVHAEAAAIAFAAKNGARTGGATLYSTLSPCYDCAKLIINAGIARVVFRYAYRDTRGIELLERANVQVVPG